MSLKEADLDFEREILRDRLKNKWNKWEVNVFGWDFDDTVADTRSVFDKAKTDATGILLFGSDWNQEDFIDREKIKKIRTVNEEITNKIMWRLRPEMGINPAISEATVAIAAKIMGVNNTDRVTAATERMKDIYRKDIPKVYEGVIETLDILNSTGIRTVLLTHASEEWTRIKRTGCGLSGKFESVYCFSIDQPKAAQWDENLKKAKIDPSRMIMVGDNYWGDINPVLERGGRGVWVTNGNQTVFGVESGLNQNNENKLTDRLITIERSGQLISTLLAKD